MTKIPLGPKLVFAFLIVGLVSGVFWFLAGATSFGHLLGIVINIALLIGLYTRQTIAWVTARWLSGIAIAFMSIIFVLMVMFGATKLWVLAWFGLELALECFFFAVLGRADSRAYFNAPRRKDEPPTPTDLSASG